MGVTGQGPAGAGGEAESIWVSWSGGKDSALALHRLRSGGHYRVTRLLSVVPVGPPETYRHGVSKWMVRAQATALNVPLVEIEMPVEPDAAAYGRRMKRVLARARAAGVRRVAFGDIFLEGVRRRREERMAAVGMVPAFPLWGEDTRALAEEVLELGYQARVTTVRLASGLSADRLGVPFGRLFLAGLPPNVDPCGEDGEFQTFVHDGPLFGCRVDFRFGPLVSDGRYAWRAVLPPRPTHAASVTVSR